MTFDEWCRQIKKESDSTIPYDLVKDIMKNAIRIAIEEFLANPADADLSITGIGRFYLNHRICHNNFPTEDKPEYATAWTIHFRPARPLKEVFNGKRDYREMLIGHNIPLYPDYMMNEDGTMKMGCNKNKPIQIISKHRYTVKTHESYEKAWNKARRKAIKESLPQEDGQLPRT